MSPDGLGREGKFPQGGWSEMAKNQNNIKSYAFVLDSAGRKLSPTLENKAWYLVRKNRATVVQLIPLVIKLTNEVKVSEIDITEIRFGSDEGSKFTGVAIVQKCLTKNKVLFKGTIEQRQDVKHLMDVRRGYRRYRRNHKKYRPKRFSNRGSSMRIGRIAPSIKQKRETTVRILKRFEKHIRISTIFVEDVKIDIRALSEGNRLYRWQYQKSNRLDENLRKAVIMRDKNTCVMCGKTDCEIEVHHITARRHGGADSIYNLCCTCKRCHKKITGNEVKYAEQLYAIINGRKVHTASAQHVMQGKTYLHKELKRVADVTLTIGSETANRRIDWGIVKTHSNDAVVICGLEVNSFSVDIKDWIIKPMRRKSKAKTEEVSGFRHRDVIKYTKKNKSFYEGYITALYPAKNQFNFTDFKGKVFKRYSLKNASLVWRFNKIYYF